VKPVSKHKDLVERGFRRYTRNVYYKRIGDATIFADLNRNEVSITFKLPASVNIVGSVSVIEKIVDHMQSPDKHHRFLPRMLVVYSRGNISEIGIAAEDPKPFLDFIFSIARERGYRVRETEDLYVIENRVHPQLNLWDPQLYIAKPRKFEKDHTLFIFIPRRSELKELPQLLQQRFSFTGIDYTTHSTTPKLEALPEKSAVK
jgi:hypothetical protein